MFGYSIHDYKSLPELVEAINSGVLSTNPEKAAAEYAVDAVLSYNGYTAPIDLEDELSAHLNILWDAGAEVDFEAALSEANILYVDELRNVLAKSAYTLKVVKSNVVFNNDDVNVIIATFDTPYGSVEFSISFWMYEDGPTHRDVFLYHDGTEGKKFSAIHPAGYLWIEIAAALAIDLVDVAKLFTKGEKK